MINGEFTTVKVKPNYNGSLKTLRDILIDFNDVPEEFFIKTEDINRENGWRICGFLDDSQHKRNKSQLF